MAKNPVYPSARSSGGVSFFFQSGGRHDPPGAFKPRSARDAGPHPDGQHGRQPRGDGGGRGPVRPHRAHLWRPGRVSDKGTQDMQTRNLSCGYVGSRLASNLAFFKPDWNHVQDFSQQHDMRPAGCRPPLQSKKGVMQVDPKFFSGFHKKEKVFSLTGKQISFEVVRC